MSARKATPIPDLPQRLKNLRMKHALTQFEAAERWGVNPWTWIKWENEASHPTGLARTALLQLLKAEGC
jgi:DNA-binding transcriptional regulator YiaG